MHIYILCFFVANFVLPPVWVEYIKPTGWKRSAGRRATIRRLKQVSCRSLESMVGCISSWGVYSGYEGRADAHWTQSYQQSVQNALVWTSDSMRWELTIQLRYAEQKGQREQHTVRWHQRQRWGCLMHGQNRGAILHGQNRGQVAHDSLKVPSL